MPKVIFIRGVPGSGKSTMAKNRYGSAKHFESDMYFMRDGQYKWNPYELGHAHRWCFIQFRDAAAAGHDVVVSNTFVRTEELENYIIEAEAKGYEIVIHELKGGFQNVHGVSPEKVEQMLRRFQDLPPEWKKYLTK